MKTVAIVGAGPSGLIAARKILQCGNLSLTIFEKGDQIGGSWVSNGIIHPEMRTNHFRSSMSFSDLSWSSVTLDRPEAPIYPKANHVKLYLEEYYNKYIPRNAVRFNSEVISANRNEQEQWKLIVKSTSLKTEAQEECFTFDYILIAPGVFTQPSDIRSKLVGESMRGMSVPLLYSTQYRTLNDILHSTDQRSEMKGNIVVVGGSHSGCEMSALIALQLSDTRFSPTFDATIRPQLNYKVIHLTSRDSFAVPGFVRDSTAATCTFQPFDFLLLNRSNSQAEPFPKFTFGLTNSEKSKTSRELIGTVIHGNEGDIEVDDTAQLPPLGSFSETYTQFLQRGDISQIKGTLGRLEGSEHDDRICAVIDSVSGVPSSFKLDNVVAVMFATGFDVDPVLSFLSREVKDKLGYLSSCPQAPLILDIDYLSRNSSLPNFAMVGFPGAYWGHFEMQARAIAAAWGANPLIPRSTEQEEHRQNLLRYYNELRTAITEGRKSEIPRNSFGDMVGQLEQASRELGLDRFDLGFAENQGPVCPSRYIDRGADKSEAMKTLSSIQSIKLHAKHSGGFLARVVFHGLLGQWVSAQKENNGQTHVLGLEFHPRYPTDKMFDWEYLVIERKDDEYTRKVYRYEEMKDQITIWSVSEKDGLHTDKLLFKVDFNAPDQKHGKDTAVAASIKVDADGSEAERHAVFRFLFTGATLKTFMIGEYSEGILASKAQYIRVERGV